MSRETKADVWFPLVVGDYLKGTSRLTTEQHGAYLLLLMEYWVEGPPPDDDEALAQITRMDLKRWRQMRPKLERYFTSVDGQWRNKRSDEERERWAEKKRLYTERASAGGRAKSAKSSASSTIQAPKNTGKNVLEGCTASASREVRAPNRALTLSEADSISDLKEGRAEKPSSLEDERDWAIAKVQAEDDLLRYRRSDPDRASELAEFIAHASEMVATLRRARLSVVAA